MDSGTKQVDLNGVVVSIPDTWSSDDANYEAPVRSGKTVSVFSGRVPGDPSRSSSVTLIDGPRKGAKARLGDLRPVGRVGGYEVLASTAVAMLSAPGRCSQGFGIPDLNAWFQVTVWSDHGGVEAIGRIRDSLTLSGGAPQSRATPE